MDQRYIETTAKLNRALGQIMEDAAIHRQYTVGRRCNASSGRLGMRRNRAPGVIRDDVRFLKAEVDRLSVEYEEALRDVLKTVKVKPEFLESVRTTRMLLMVFKKMSI